MTPETILNAAIGVLKQRGRCKHRYTTITGRVDLLGALAVARGSEPDLWMGLRELLPGDIYGNEKTLVDAARYVVKVVAPLQPADEMSVNRLAGVLGDTNDCATDEQVYEWLAKAAALAERAGVPS